MNDDRNTTGTSKHLQQFFTGVLIVGVLFGVSRFIFLSRDIVLARTLGPSPSLDGFLFAWSILLLLQAVFAQSLGHVLVPRYVEKLSRAPVKVSAWALPVLPISLIALVFAAVICLLKWTTLSPSASTSAGILLLGGGVWLIGSSSISVSAAILQAHGRWLVTGATQCFSASCFLLGIYLLPSEIDVSMRCLIGGGLGAAIEAIVLQYALQKCRAKDSSYLKVPLADATLWWLAVSNLLMGTSQLIDLSFAASLGENAISTLALAARIPLGICSIGGYALGAVVLPMFSRAKALGGDYVRSSRTIIIYSAALAAFTSFALAYMSTTIATYSYGSEQFDLTVVHEIAALQSLYFLAIPLFIVEVLLWKLVVSHGKTRALFPIALVKTVVNLMGNALLIGPFGLMGIVFSTLIVLALSICLTAIKIRNSKQDSQTYGTPS